MRVRFYGVRGSLPAPILPSQIRSRMSAVLARVTEDDLRTPESRESFLARLPPWIFGAVGGNTPCVAVPLEERREVAVFDAGTGLRELGAAAARTRPEPLRYHLFLSHFHWDHIQGLPFFGPAYDPRITLEFYAHKPAFEKFLRGQMAPPYFPVTLDALKARKVFHVLPEDTASLTLGGEGVKITWKKMGHPGDSFAYRLDDGKRRFVYATDVELSTRDFARTEENLAFFSQADLLVIDAQYSLAEAAEKGNWGHSAFILAVDFAASWGIKHVALFHHDPANDDRKLFGMCHDAQRYARRRDLRGMVISLATEGQEIRL